MRKSRVQENRVVGASPELTRRELARWLWGVTRPVLRPLLRSTLARFGDQLAGIALFVLPAIFIANTVTANDDCGCLLTGQVNLWGLAAVMLLLAGLKAGLRYYEQYSGHLVAFQALELLRARAYQALWPQAPGIVERSHRGDLLERLTKDIDRIEVFFAHTLAPAVSAVAVPGVVATLTFVLAPWPLGVTVVFVLVVGLLIPWIGARDGHRCANSRLAARGGVAVRLSDSLQGLAEVVGYGLEELRLGHLQKSGAALRIAEVRASRAAALRDATLQAWRLLAVLLILLSGGSLYIQENASLSLAVLLGTLFAVLRCWDVLRGVTGFGTELNTSFAAARRVYRLMHAGLALPEGDAPIPPGALGFHLKGVSFCHEERGLGLETMRDAGAVPEKIKEKSVNTTGGFAATGVWEIDLEIKPGAWTALVGVTASGKTTLTRLLARYFDPDAGTVKLAAENGAAVNLPQLRLEDLWSAVAVVTPDVTLLNMTVAENLRLAAPRATEAQLWWALDMSCLSDEVRAMDGGLAYPVGAQGSALSGGQRQRLALAQALLRGARILILDEYTANLPPELAVAVRQNLLNLRAATAGQLTVIEVCHNLDQIEQADWIAVLDLGRIVEQGTPKEILPCLALNRLNCENFATVRDSQ